MTPRLSSAVYTHYVLLLVGDLSMRLEPRFTRSLETRAPRAVPVPG